MRINVTLTSLAIFPGAAIDSVSAAACYGSGADFGNKNDAIYHIGRACGGYDGKRGPFVQNLNTGSGFNLADNDCALRLGIIVNDCLRGGEDTIAGWKFR